MISALLTFSFLLASCDMGSYNPIARALDPFEPMGTDSVAWMNVDGNKGSSSTQVLVLQQGVPVNTQVGGYAYIEIYDNTFPSPVTEIVLVRGTYEVSGTELIFYPYAEYRGSYRQTSSPTNNPAPLDRQGEIQTMVFSYNSGNLSLGSPAIEFTALRGAGGVLDTIFDLNIPGNTEEIRASKLLLVNQIGLYASQVIVPGFGGPGMMTYYKKQTPFSGLVDGNELILMSSALPTARVDFDYEGMDNLPKMTMTGTLRTDANAKGNGDMSETVTTHIDDGNNPDYDMSVSYDDIKITGTIPSSGNYAVSVSGVLLNVSYLDLTPGNLDFPGIMIP